MNDGICNINNGEQYVYNSNGTTCEDCGNNSNGICEADRAEDYTNSPDCGSCTDGYCANYEYYTSNT